MSESASNSGRTLVHCEHVYKHVGAILCPHCGYNTHETDWSIQHELHREWIASGKAKFGGWWSI
jgi:hypothetical protein